MVVGLNVHTHVEMGQKLAAEHVPTRNQLTVVPTVLDQLLTPRTAMKESALCHLLMVVGVHTVAGIRALPRVEMGPEVVLGHVQTQPQQMVELSVLVTQLRLRNAMMVLVPYHLLMVDGVHMVVGLNALSHVELE